jgi:hypothetical protein
LYARKVKNLRCERAVKSDFESTLYWTEFPKFLPNPEGPNAPLRDDPSKWSRQVSDERYASFTKSPWGLIQEK